MSAGEGPYGFRAATGADLSLLRAWLQTPQVALWWGEPEEEYAILEADLNEPEMVMRVVSRLGRPFAYAQDYPAHLWPQPHLAHLPVGARAIDAFIGAPDMLDGGHGSAFLRRLAQRLIAEGAPAVAIDPSERNLRARRAFEKARPPAVRWS
jgi:aminoglycoside 6'-N-acetyltransferase